MLVNKSVTYETVGSTPCGRRIDNVKICVGWDTYGNPKFKFMRLVYLGTFFRGGRTAYWIKQKDLNTFLQKYNSNSRLAFTSDMHREWKNKTYTKDRKNFPFDLYACSSLCKDTGIREVRHIGTFRARPERIDLYIHDYNNDITPNYRKIDNLKVIRHIQHGDPLKPLTCRISGKIVEGLVVNRNKQKKVLNIMNMHHIVVKEGRSTGKIDENPATLITKTYLRNNKDSIRELLGTICLSSDEHIKIHAWKNSDISFYKKRELPWALQNENNFNSICKEYGLQENYSEFLKSLRLP